MSAADDTTRGYLLAAWDISADWVPDQPAATMMVLRFGPAKGRDGEYTTYLLRPGEEMLSHGESFRSVAKARRQVLRSFPGEAYVRYVLTREELEAAKSFITEASGGRLSLRLVGGRA